MKTYKTSFLVAALLAAFTLSHQLHAQSSLVRPPSKNQSANLKSGIFRGSGNLVEPRCITSTIGGGQSNVITSESSHASIGGGFGNRVLGREAAIAGGRDNTAAGISFVGGGSFNKALGSDGAIVGGSGNTITNTARFSSIAGGHQNLVAAIDELVGGVPLPASATIGGGRLNRVGAVLGTVSGGQFNTNNGRMAFIGGGEGNAVSANHGVVAGGRSNSVTAFQASVGGGGFNSAEAAQSVIGGGNGNKTTGSFAVVGGGQGNKAGSLHATVPGGQDNNAAGSASFAAGTSAEAVHDRAFVWGDGSLPTLSTNTNTFTVRASGGAKFLTGATAAGPSLGPNSPDWSSSSDSNLKTAVTAVDHRAVLAKVASMPVTSWRFKHDTARSFLGPMAQDFRAAFGLGRDDKTIGTLDADGVLFSSVKGLLEEIKERDKTIAELEAKSARVDQLEVELRAIREQLSNLPPR